MSTQPRSHDDEVVELTIRLRHLLVTVRGSPEPCLSLQDPLLALGPRLLNPRILLKWSLQLVILLLLVVLVCWNLGIRSPRLCYLFCFLVVASFSSGWFCLCWSVPNSQSLASWPVGACCLGSKSLSPNRSEPLDLRCRFYVVLRREGLDCPVVFLSSGSYWSALGSFVSAGVPIPSVIHSQASVKLVSTWTLLDSLNPTCFVTRDVCGK